MKKWLKKYLPAICAGCLAFDLWLPLPLVSNFLFGEPDFPYED